jgi:hypothetical protein
MSIDYTTMKTIKFADLVDGRLAKRGITISGQRFAADMTFLGDGSVVNGPLVKSEPSHHEEAATLTDGENYLDLYAGDDRNLRLMTVRSLSVNNPGRILGVIAEVFDTEIVSEYDYRFWGYDTGEEYEAAMAALNKQFEDEYYVRMIDCPKGGPNPYADNPGCIGDLQIQLAKKLVAENPELLAPVNRRRLLDTIER